MARGSTVEASSLFRGEEGDYPLFPLDDIALEDDAILEGHLARAAHILDIIHGVEESDDVNAGVTVEWLGGQVVTKLNAPQVRDDLLIRFPELAIKERAEE